MKDTIINLTPPIDGVQYGISITDKITEGYVYDLADKAVVFIAEITNIGARLITENIFRSLNQYAKIIGSTNPKDTRFPYLVMPSKEQEVKTYYKWVEVSKYGLPTKDGYYPVKREDNLNPLNWYIDIAKWNNKPKLWSRVIEWLAPVNANKIDIEKVSEIDDIAAQLEDTLHGSEGKLISEIRKLLAELK